MEYMTLIQTLTLIQNSDSANVSPSQVLYGPEKLLSAFEKAKLFPKNFSKNPIWITHRTNLK